MTAGFSEISTPCHCGVLRQATRYVSQAYDDALAPAGLKATQLAIFSAIHSFGDQLPTMRELAKVLVMDRSTLGHNLRPLERDGWVVLGAGTQDARHRHVSLTPAGRAKFKEAVALWKKMQKRFEKAFGAGATVELRTALLKLTTIKLKTT